MLQCRDRSCPWTVVCYIAGTGSALKCSMLHCRDQYCPCNIACYISICKMEEVHKDMSWGQSFSLPHTCHMPCLSHPPWFGHPYNVCCTVPIMKLLIMQFSPVPAISSLLGPNIFLSILFLNTPSLCSSVDTRDQVLHLHLKLLPFVHFSEPPSEPHSPSPLPYFP